MRSERLLDNTLIILTSDHGEGLGDHDEIGHVHQLYNTMIHVPLIISCPRLLKGGMKIGTRMRQIDLMPTILDLLHIKTGIKYTGDSLLPVVKGRCADNRQVLSMTFTPEAKYNLVSLIEGHHKIIWNQDLNTYELYDLLNDPAEHENMVQRNNNKFGLMQKKLQLFLDNQNFSRKLKTRRNIPGIIDEERKKKLKALGYTQ
jgi:arylsulfatase A-like enzyme